MHWGVRRSREEIASGTTRVTQPKAGGKLKSEGGKGYSAHPDAIKTAHTKQIAKGSGVHALSNLEIQQAVTRMNLEQQYSRLSTPKKSAGHQFVSNLLGNAAKQQVTRVANERITQQVNEAMKNK